MNRFIFSALLFVSSTALATAEDLIRSQAGCYEVRFDFVEDKVFDPNYDITSEPYHEKGIEWITVNRDEPGRISLQHVLVLNKEVQKHWRQEWLYQEPSYFEFKGDATWERQDKSNVTGLWQRRTFQVDDSPRSECFGTWDESKKSFTCQAWSPLPRREYSERDDYNILDRTNTHSITSTGWVLAEDNTKLSVLNNNVTKIAHETGANTYIRLDESVCESAKIWWQKNGNAWGRVQDMWDHIRSHHDKIVLKTPAGQKSLWVELFALTEDAVAKNKVFTTEFMKAVHDKIHEYLAE